MGPLNKFKVCLLGPVGDFLGYRLRFDRDHEVVTPEKLKDHSWKVVRPDSLNQKT